jgi:hypothetical protein
MHWLAHPFIIGYLAVTRNFDQRSFWEISATSVPTEAGLVLLTNSNIYQDHKLNEYQWRIL